MATYSSDLSNKGIRFRGRHDGQINSVTGRITIPSGVTLTAGDVLKVANFGERTGVLSITVRASGDHGLDANNTADIGALQLVDGNGTAIVVDNKTGSVEGTDKFTSPATSAAYFSNDVALPQTGAILRVAADELVNVDPVAGPYCLGLTIVSAGTAPAATVADVDLYVTVEYVTRSAEAGEFSGETAYQYADRYNGTDSSGGLVS